MSMFALFQSLQKFLPLPPHLFLPARGRSFFGRKRDAKFVDLAAQAVTFGSEIFLKTTFKTADVLCRNKIVLYSIYFE
jgi:hypothetical protein